MNNVIVECMFGSYLYGTNSEDSDTDMAMVFLPSKRDILLGNVFYSGHTSTKKGDRKNTKDDTDTLAYSLHSFFKNLKQGKIDVLDILYAPDNCITKSSILWEEIRANHKLFHSKNTEAFVKYTRTQAGKYGCKGSRIAVLEGMIEFLTKYPECKLSYFWNNLPITEFSYFIDPAPNGIKQYQVCDRILQETITTEYALTILNKVLKNYGNRAQLAKENKGIDWKAVSHAIRAATEMIEIIDYGRIRFPLHNAKFLREVKQGQYDYSRVVAPHLEWMSKLLSQATKDSNLPDEVDSDAVDNYLCKLLEDCISYEDFH